MQNSRRIAMRRLALAISCGLLLAGCQLYWTKPEATLADFTAAPQACLRSVGTPLPGDSDSVLINPESYKTCRRANGWQRIEDGTIATQAGRFRGIEEAKRPATPWPPSSRGGDR